MVGVCVGLNRYYIIRVHDTLWCTYGWKIDIFIYSRSYIFTLVLEGGPGLHGSHEGHHDAVAVDATLQIPARTDPDDGGHQAGDGLVHGVVQKRGILGPLVVDQGWHMDINSSAFH